MLVRLPDPQLLRTLSTGKIHAMNASNPHESHINLHIGHEELVIRNRYETLSIANDVLIGLVFLVGSFLFFSESTVTLGTWLFVIGSFQMLIRPTIRLVRRIHLQKVYPQSPADTVRDY